MYPDKIEHEMHCIAGVNKKLIDTYEVSHLITPT